MAAAVDTLHHHLDQYSMYILIDTRSTLDRHLINTQSIAKGVLTNLIKSIDQG